MNDFELVKSKLNIKDVITGATNMKVVKGHLQECPFCSGHECFSIPGGNRSGSFKCFQCDKGGDVLTFLEHFHSTDKKGALQIGADLANVELKEYKPKAVRMSVPDKIRMAAAEHYHQNMLNNGGKKHLIEERGHKIETLQREMVGFSDGGLLGHLKGLKFDEKDIIASGLAQVKKVKDRDVVLDLFGKGLVVFPHLSGKKVLLFTQKDPKKKLKFQMKLEYRDKKWRFYGQDALNRYEEIILCEGESDRLQVLNAGIDYVMAMIGQISDDQIKSLAINGKGKTLYLWVDNDEAGAKYIRKICNKLPGLKIRIMVYGKRGDDPDSYLKGFDGDRRKEIKRLQLEALDYISWELMQAAALENLEEKLLHLKDFRIFQLIGQEQAIRQDVYKEKLGNLGFSVEAISQQLDFSQDLKQRIQAYVEMFSDKKDVDPIALAEIIFKFFAQQGRFYYDREHQVWLIYQNKTYEVSNNIPFNALMLKMTRMIITQAPGGQVWDALKHTAYLNGRQIDVCRWIHTDQVKDTIYINLNGQNNNILKISKDKIEEIQNGMNDDHVLLSSSGKIAPMTFRPDTDIQEGMTALKELMFDNLVVAKEQKYLILSWLISGLCPDMAPYQFLMKFGGYASSGKSTAAKFLSVLFYGSELLSDPSNASAYSSSAQNPLLVIDNLENKDLNRGMTKFLLLAATRGQKEKRKGGTDTDTVDESPRSLLCITAIEPFTLSELISRTFEIPFDRRVHGSDTFYEAEVLEDLKKKRDMIMSALVRFIQKEILPNLDQRKVYMGILNKQYKGHAKDRTNAYLALLMLINAKLLKYIPLYAVDDVAFGSEHDEPAEKLIYDKWIREQNSTAKDTEKGSNPILQLLSGLVREYIHHNKDAKLEYHEDYQDIGEVFVLEHKDYNLTLIKTKPDTQKNDDGDVFLVSTIEFVATSAEMVDTFNMLSRNIGATNPYTSGSILSSRLRNDRNTLKDAGWVLVESGRENVKPYFKILGGERFFKFRYTLIR